MRKILIKIRDTILSVELNNSEVANKVLEILPLESKTQIWGEEIYFEVPLKTGIDNPTESVSKGDIAFWPQGSCFCIFFGPTPDSPKDEIRPASAVEIIGKLNSEVRFPQDIKESDKVTVTSEEK